MSANIKVGNNTLSDVDAVSFRNADIDGAWAHFYLNQGTAQLLAPTIALNDRTLAITPANNGAFAQYHDLYAGDTLMTSINVATTTIDLSTITFPERTNTLVVKSRGAGMLDSIASNSVTYNVPYTITDNITNGTLSGATYIFPNGTAQVTIVPDGGYIAPTSISVVGASVVYSEGAATLSNPTGDVTITGECIESGVEKGQIISMDLTGSGTPQEYRVIKVNGSIAEVIAMTNASDSQQFASSGQTYENSTLDTYLNTTWYNTLSNEAKQAIVDQTFRQDSWYWGADGNPDYNGYYGTAKPGTSAYTVSLGNSSFGNEITRHVYALSTQDVLDYVLDINITDGQLQNYNIWKMFWNDEVQHTGNNNVIWLRSARATYSSYAFGVYGDIGGLDSSRAYSSFAVRPALTIDLSKIQWS